MKPSKPQINQPLEALHHIRCIMEADEERTGNMKVQYLPYKPVGICNCSCLIPILILTLFKRGLYELFAVCLARARTDNVEAKAALSHIIHNPTFSTSKPGTTALHVREKVYLAHVLRWLGEDSEAHKLYVKRSLPLVILPDKLFREIWLVRWFKKYPHRIKNSVLVPMFTTDIDPAMDPVFVGLGGSKWLDDRKAALKIQIIEKRSCQNCHASKPQVKLLKCSKCKYTSYWSVITPFLLEYAILK